ncbi:hypothetical protein [Sphaerisporangium fuscum]|uniref:hypothetical protein n=1 Tax=Sphaerisporangium fuscum TaxID=2835868 RepID=UPI001BDCE292|nr:hypothetical protein [Sphaerisporangium fuscum]
METAGEWPEVSVAAGLPSGDCAALFRALTVEEADVKRRELLFELAMALGGLPALRLLRHLSADEEVRLAQAVQGPGRVDAQSVTAIEKLIAQCWRLDEAYGPSKVFRLANAQRDLVARLLHEKSLTPALRDRLVTAYWSLSHLGGWLRYDVLDYAGAVQWYGQGLEAAHELGDPTRLSHMHGCLAILECDRGRPTQALDHAFAAQAWAQESPSRLQRAVSSQTLARALVDAGRGDHGLRALDRAYDLASASRTEIDPPHLYWCTPARMLWNRGHCLAATKRPDDAIKAGEQVLTQLHESAGRARGLVLLEQTKAFVQKREIIAAAQKLSDVADITTRHTSVRLVDSIRTTRQQLQPWATNTYVRDLDEKLRELGIAG